MGVLLPLIKLVNHYYFDDANFMDFAHMASWWITQWNVDTFISLCLTLHYLWLCSLIQSWQLMILVATFVLCTIYFTCRCSGILLFHVVRIKTVGSICIPLVFMNTAPRTLGSGLAYCDCAIG
jgi:hypothetical protein